MLRIKKYEGDRQIYSSANEFVLLSINNFIGRFGVTTFRIETSATLTKYIIIIKWEE